jgi:hypothetical protein
VEKRHRQLEIDPSKWENVPTIEIRPSQVGKRPRQLELDPSKWENAPAFGTRPKRVENISGTLNSTRG